jgi:hypothetical protein
VLQKYRYLTDEAETKEAGTYKPARIVRENLEKYFLVHFRLLPLAPAELVEVMDKYVRALEPETPTPTSDPAPRPAVGGAVAPSESQASSGEVTSSVGGEQKQNLSGGTLATISPIEARVLREAARGLVESVLHEEWGPRAVRSLLFRYVLARELLLAVGERIDPALLATALVRAWQKTTQEGDGDVSRTLRRVVDQVS